MAQARIGRGFSGIFTRAGERGRGRSFVVIGLEGIAVALLGLYMILVPDTARDNIRTIAGLALIVLALVGLALLMAFYAHELGYGAGLFAWSAVLLLAGGHVGLLAAALWSVAGGCFVAIARLALTPPAGPVGGGNGFDEHGEITIRGPLSYAGPGSLGGTRSALRR